MALTSPHPWRLAACGLLCLLRLLLDLLLMLPDLGQAASVDNVSNRSVNAFLAVGTGCLPPALGRDRQLLAQQGEEDPCLLVSEARQSTQSAE